MAQHFLLSAKARTLSLAEVARMSDDEAYDAFRAVRFAETGGKPVCPRCGCDAVYEIRTRRRFTCKACNHQFSLTSGTIFANRKLPLRDLLLAIVLFIDGVKGNAALHLSRQLKCDYKTAFVLEHKLREVMGSLRVDRKLTGEVEVDGAWFGGHIRKTNLVKNRRDRRSTNPKRRSVVTLRERRQGGRTLTFACHNESEGVAAVLANVHRSAQLYVDDGSHWELLFGPFEKDPKKVNHSKDGYSVDDVSTNIVESFNGRLRRAEIGIHHKIAGSYLQGYADEMAWREDYRRVDNGMQFATLLGACARQPTSERMTGYWQRHLRPAALAQTDVEHSGQARRRP